MAESGEQKDQSMEEILQSIKRIIADDDVPVEAAAKPKAAAATPPKPLDITTVKGSDVLELHDLVEEGNVPAAAPQADSLDVLAAIDAGISEAATAPGVTPAIDTPKTPVAGDILADIDGLLTTQTVQASASALDQLKQKATKPQEPDMRSAMPSPSFRSGQTLEDLVIEVLRPELKAWLNQHLPEIVERMVAAEIKKITGN